MSDASVTSLTHCPNCGQRLNPWDQFCSQCGQDTKDHAPSFWEFVHEWSLHYVAVEGKLWKSLWALIAKPGFLTLEYLAGRKQRYVLPLRLLLTFGLLFFLSLKLVPSAMDDVLQVKAEEDTPEQVAQAASKAREGLAQAGLPAPAASAIADAMAQAAQDKVAQQAKEKASGPPAPIVLDPGDREKLPAWMAKPLERFEARYATNREAAWLHLKGTLLSLAPYGVLMSLPLFAALLKLLFPRTVYGAHFLFAMHLHAAWYFMLLLVVLLHNWAGLVVFGIWVWSNLYPLMALRRVNGSGWPSTLLRGAVLAFLHWFVIASLLLFLLAAGVVSA